MLYMSLSMLTSDQHSSLYIKISYVILVHKKPRFLCMGHIRKLYCRGTCQDMLDDLLVFLVLLVIWLYYYCVANITMPTTDL